MLNNPVKIRKIKEALGSDVSRRELSTMIRGLVPSPPVMSHNLVSTNGRFVQRDNCWTWNGDEAFKGNSTDEMIEIYVLCGGE